MKLKCVNFSQPVTVGSTPKTFLLDTDYELDLKGNFIDIKAIRPDNTGVRPGCIATIFNVVYFKLAESEGKNSLKNAV